jgi:DNA-binding MarR family transcriptional regulator
MTDMPQPELTFQEKTLIHLLNFKKLDDSFELPSGVTQKGIADSIGAQRKHMPRILKKLKEKGLISEERGRVSGSTQRMKVYILTWEGISSANKIRKYAENLIIKVKDKNGKICEMAICDVNKKMDCTYSLLEIINNITPDGIFQGIEEEEEEEYEKMPPKQEIYWHTLLQVWKDGRSSVDEEEILEELRKILGISEHEHALMQKKIIKYAHPVRKKLLEIYEAAYEEALSDQQITEDERAILRVLRDKLAIGEEEREKLEGKVNKKKVRK